MAAHAAWCHARYTATETKARTLLAAVEALVATPGAATLFVARTAWSEARAVYGETEVLRFHDGPIEPLEPFPNAWPLDEAYLDYVAGAPAAGLVQDTVRFPNPTATVLRLANERGGEANVSTGWHAIEFLLWGQDLDPDGPGCRPATDYDPLTNAHAARRGACLVALTRMLADDLATVRKQWDADADNYRRRFERDVDGSMRRMLVGCTVLTTFELAGERLTVALETHDQEQEHSCFSDTTCQDLVANQRGIAALACGAERLPGIADLVATTDAALAARLRERVQAASERIAAIPRPFDRSLRAGDRAGNRAIQAAIEALEAQSEVLLLVGKSFGIELPLAPGG